MSKQLLQEQKEKGKGDPKSSSKSSSLSSRRRLERTMKNRMRRYLRTEYAGGPTWHPAKDDPRVIAFAYDSDEGRFQIWRVNIDSSVGVPLWPRKLTFAPHRCTDPYFLPDGTCVYHQDTNGDENFQIGIIDEQPNAEDHTYCRILTTDKSAKHIITHTTETHIYFRANIREKSQFDLWSWKIPLYENTPELFYENTKRGVIPAVKAGSPDGRYLIIRQEHSHTWHQLSLWDEQKKEVRPLTENLSPSTSQYRWFAVDWLDDVHILVITDYHYDNNLLHFGVINIKYGKLRMVEGPGNQYEIDPNCVVLRRNFFFDRNVVYFSENVRGYSKLFRTSISTDGICASIEFIPLPTSTDGMIYSRDTRMFSTAMSLSGDGNYLAVTFSSPTEPCNIWITDTKTQKVKWWRATNVHTGGLDKRSFVDANVKAFKSFDGETISYWRFVPESAEESDTDRAYPCVIIIHGGPEHQARSAFSSRNQYFLSQGFAVIEPNIRGSYGYGRRFLDLDNKGLRLNAIRDIAELAKHLKEDKDIDHERLCVMGGSYGGFATLSVLTEHPDIFRAGIALYGVSNYITFLQNTAKWRRPKRELEYGSLKEDLGVLERISPINSVDKIKVPLLMIYGERDERVPIGEAEQFYEKVQKVGVPCKLLRFPNEGHGITLLDNKLTAYREMILWLQKYVAS